MQDCLWHVASPARYAWATSCMLLRSIQHSHIGLADAPKFALLCNTLPANFKKQKSRCCMFEGVRPHRTRTKKQREPVICNYSPATHIIGMPLDQNLINLLVFEDLYDCQVSLLNSTLLQTLYLERFLVCSDSSSTKSEV